jgi:two-component system chemotaxis response regulator CheY
MQNIPIHAQGILHVELLTLSRFHGLYYPENMFPADSKILVVEDMNSIREYLVSLMKELGFSKIHDCKDGADAWEKIQAQKAPFELIISDLNMPKSSGLDLLTRLRSSAVYKTTPFIMISSKSDTKSIVSAIQAGADHFIVKPVSRLELQEKLKTVFERKSGANR